MPAGADLSVQVCERMISIAPKPQAQNVCAGGAYIAWFAMCATRGGGP
jgi:hypothetical protein